MKIGIFGNYGWGNLGNSATLEAAVAGVHKFWPQAAIVCICTHPLAVHTEYGYEVAPVRWDDGEGVQLPPGRVARTVTRLLQRPPSEVRLWRRAREIVQELDLLMVAGTGVLDDYAIGPMDLPYDLFKWSVQARRRHVPLVYLSAGAGPIDHRRSRTLIKTALRQARYRSFRDEYSRRYLLAMGFDCAHDPIYPDLAFGLPIPQPLLGPGRRAETAPQIVVGLGVMSYSGTQTSAEEGERLYQEYLAKIVRFGTQLLAAGHAIRLLAGDTLVDERALRDTGSALAAAAAGHGRREYLIAEPIHSVADLLYQISCTDVVVATRFHNVLLALLLEKPVLSISYNQKNDDLMEEMGLGAYCQAIRQLDLDFLALQFDALVANAGAIQRHVAVQNQRQRERLDEQYAHVAALIDRQPMPHRIQKAS
jgi:polysaccharide pyruvyl transferase WcaK-like protein